jgi:hypothetical protein
VRHHPTIEQLESLPVNECLNGIVDSNSDLLQPPENEDDHIESNVETDLRSVGLLEANGYSKDVDMLEDTEAPSPETEAGLTLEEFIEHVRSKGRRGLYEEYAEIKSRPPSGTFNNAR